MTSFLALLSAYYICDATAAARVMQPDEVRACTGIYEQVKGHFLEDALAPAGTVERAEQMRAAYGAYRGWVSDNAGLVAEMRAEAREAVRRGATAG